jgi:hypothetical protein
LIAGFGGRHVLGAWIFCFVRLLATADGFDRAILCGFEDLAATYSPAS